MTDDGMRAWAATQAEVEALRAEVAQLRAERDAVIGAFICGPTIIGQTYFIVGTDLGLDGARFRDHASAVAAVRRAAGLEAEEKETPR
jgi:hypothetical protein